MGWARQASPGSFGCRALSFDEGGGKPPHSKMGWAWMLGAGAMDQIVGSAEGEASGFGVAV
jgi:hypothetical protein